jgi:phosphatidylglycerophosphate synthase
MAHAGGMLACLSFAFFTWGTRAFALFGLCSLSVLVGLAKGRFTPRGHFGSANAVTALRAAIVAALPWAALQLDGPLVAGIAVAVLALDVVDGYLARRHGNASDFGSSFDVETDALFVMVLSLVLYERGAAGPWVILAGAWRYVYVLAPLLVKTEEPQGRRSVFGRLAFVLMIVSFVLGLLLPPQTSQPVVALGVAVVSASFLYSFWLRYFARTH